MKIRVGILLFLVLVIGFIAYKFSIVTISDASMMPTFDKGKRVIVHKSSLKKLKRNTLIAFHKPSISDKAIKQKPKQISRLIALPGDTLIIKNRKVYINGKLRENTQPLFMKYRISIDSEFSKESLNPYNYSDLQEVVPNLAFELYCTSETAETIKQLKGVVTTRLLTNLRREGSTVFPQNSFYISWNKDYFGAFVIPKAGASAEINYMNFELYNRIINVYEGKRCYLNAQKVYVDNQHITHYTFEKDYYFVLNDNRDIVSDSRVIGVIPKDHIIGSLK